MAEQNTGVSRKYQIKFKQFIYQTISSDLFLFLLLLGLGGDL